MMTFHQLDRRNCTYTLECIETSCEESAGRH